MNGLIDLIKKNKAIKKFLNNEGRLVINDTLSLSYLVSAAFDLEKKNILINASNLYVAQTIYEQIASIIGEDNCLLFPVDDVYHETNYAYSKEMLSQRLYVLNKCLNGFNGILITHTNSIRRYLPNPADYSSLKISLKKGENYIIKDIIDKLIKMSFTRVNKIDQSLQFALRGDILDIYPINSEKPIRIEFFDDEIESIRYFEIETQISYEDIDSLEIYPSNDMIINASLDIGKEKILYRLEQDIKRLSFENKTQLKDKIYEVIEEIYVNGFNENLYKYYQYFQGEHFNIFDYFKSDINLFYQEEEIDQANEFKDEELKKYILELYSNGLSLSDYNFDYSLNEIKKKVENIIFSHSFFCDENDYTLELKSIPFYSRNLINSIQMIEDYKALDYKIVVCLNEQYHNNFIEFLSSKEFPYEKVEFNELPLGCLGICINDLKSGFELIEEKIIFLSKKEIFGYKHNLNIFSSRFKKAQIINNFDELNIGDYIVQETNGIGRYEGIVTLTVNEEIGDYLKLLYANDEILYIPLCRFDSIRKYVSREGVTPRLSKIGGKDWSKTKTKIKEKVNFLADRLIQLYSERELIKGFSFKEDDEFQEEFEKAFPYELTKDQVKALDDIKSDMMKPSPMDRLLCGDVGFGKTEVAFRVAFKAILSGKQVALLCPTTILAKQHYDVAVSRFSLFGVNIALISRFTTSKEYNSFLKDIKDGKIHLIIGTHRLLSKDLIFNDLGLLIVDEEQRFGVEHKERIKELTKEVDVLTLTATPIPRTLQMSLLGIRSLSQLQTPPHARMPIQTYVSPYDFRLAITAISRELSRGGQIFYLHNRVSSIYQKANMIIKALPNARVAVVHAKMDKDDIDQIMTEFYLGQIDVLVCTSIIEAGLDVPNANTIIVENADKFGLSQLYQIKGRVGRSNRVAYAYLFYVKEKEMTPSAVKRLDAIKEFTELGAGFKLASRDLSIRGAGDILGSEQSGFIDNVGLDMYVNILSEVINEKKGIKKENKKIHSFNLSLGGYIPSTYALDSDKIQLYQEVEACNNLTSIEILRRKIRDIYGRLPKEVEQLLTKRKIDILCSSNNIESVIEEEKIKITLTEEFSLKNGIAKTLNEKFAPIIKEIYVQFINKKFVIKLHSDKKRIDNLMLILQTINAL